MRVFTYSAVLCALALAHGTPGQGQTPSCDGTAKLTGKCPPYTIPQGYYEAADCQGKLKKGDLGPCLHQIAFSQDYFYCSAPQLDQTVNPPAYTSLCTDNNLVTVDCTHTRTCVSEAEYEGDVQYVVCSVKAGSFKSTTRVVKQNRTIHGSPEFNSDCKLTYPLP